jgi:adenylate cyclase
MTEKAEATARRLDQSISELERQISWVTRASVVTPEQRRDDYAQLLNQVSAITQLSQLNGYGREILRLTRRGVATNSGMDFSHDPRFK